MNRTARKPRPEKSVSDTCPKCGYCDKCGRTNATPFVPYIPYVPSIPSYPRYPWQNPWITWGIGTISTAGHLTAKSDPTTTLPCGPVASNEYRIDANDPSLVFTGYIAPGN